MYIFGLAVLLRLLRFQQIEQAQAGTTAPSSQAKPFQFAIEVKQPGISMWSLEASLRVWKQTPYYSCLFYPGTAPRADILLKPVDSVHVLCHGTACVRYDVS